MGVIPANQIQIPVLTTDNDALNQVQQNINKVLRNFFVQILEIQNFVAASTVIGEVKLASLTLAQFQAVAGKNWILANGQSAVGTAYAAFTGNRTVPIVSILGVTAFVRVN